MRHASPLAPHVFGNLLGSFRARRLAVISVVLILLALPMAACGSSAAATSSPTATPTTLTVFAAASLTGAFKSIGAAFDKAHPGNTTTFNFAGSQDLAQQISQGASADVFASANAATMNTVVQSGQVASGSQRTFAHNRLVVIVAKPNTAHIASLQDLAKPNIKLILADKVVPVGQYAQTFLDKASQQADFGSDYKTKVLKNVVSYENNVKAVLSKVQLGEADAGIVYTSDIALDSAAVTSIAIPDALNTIATYPIAPVSASKNSARAQQFIDYVLSADGQALLTKYGFIGVSGS